MDATELQKEMELVYRQIGCQKSVKDDEFSQGVQDYKILIGGKSGMIPNRSYFRIELKITNSTGAHPTTAKKTCAKGFGSSSHRCMIKRRPIASGRIRSRSMSKVGSGAAKALGNRYYAQTRESMKVARASAQMDTWRCVED